MRTKKLSGNIEKIRKLVIRDWWCLVLWYVRLRKAVKGQTPFKLLEVERHIQRNVLSMDERNKKYPGLQHARKKAAELSANPDSYQPNLSDMDSDEIEEYNKREQRRRENITKNEQE